TQWNYAAGVGGLTPTSTSAGIFVNASSTIVADLRVDGNSTTTKSLFVGAVGGTPIFTAKSETSKVGINTANPTDRLYITTAAAGDGISISGASTNAPHYALLSGSTEEGTLGLALSSAQYSTAAIAGDTILRSLGISTGN